MVIGLTVPPDFATDQRLVELSNKADVYCSFVSSELYCRFDELRFKEALIDWGFFGDSNVRPKWMQSSS
jgi:hypothetical protein